MQVVKDPMINGQLRAGLDSASERWRIKRLQALHHAPGSFETVTSPARGYRLSPYSTEPAGVRIQSVKGSSTSTELLDLE
jgi:hypothetical protein